MQVDDGPHSPGCEFAPENMPENVLQFQRYPRCPDCGFRHKPLPNPTPEERLLDLIFGTGDGSEPGKSPLDDE